MDITGKITGLKYKIFLTEELKTIDIKNFNINGSPASCIVRNVNNFFAISKWVSPKRTRSYPYERVIIHLILQRK
jgi:hypothetical protein